MPEIEPNVETVAVAVWGPDPYPAKLSLASVLTEPRVHAASLAVLLVLFGAFLGIRYQIYSCWPIMTGTFLQSSKWILRERPRPATAQDEELKEDPEDDLSEIVDLTIYQDGVKTGSDRGLMIIEGGTLIFLGRRCSFLIGIQHHVLPPVTAEFSEGDHAIYLRHPDRALALAVSAVPTRNSSVSSRNRWLDKLRDVTPEKVLRRRNRSWLKGRPAGSWPKHLADLESDAFDDESVPRHFVYPPLATDPNIKVPAYPFNKSLNVIATVVLCAGIAEVLIVRDGRFWLACITLISGSAFLLLIKATAQESFTKQKQAFDELAQSAPQSFPASLVSAPLSGAGERGEPKATATTTVNESTTTGI